MAIIQFADEETLNQYRSDFIARANDVVKMAIQEGWRDVVDPEDAVILSTEPENPNTLVFGFEKEKLTVDVPLINLSFDVDQLNDEAFQNEVVALVSAVLGSDKVLTLTDEAGLTESFEFGIGANETHAVAVLAFGNEVEVSEEDAVARLILLQDIAMHLLTFTVVPE